MAQLNPSSMSDSDLLSTTRLAAQTERKATASLVALLAEVDARRLYLGEGYSSLFIFCMRALHMSEHAAYARIEAARAARRFPEILTRLADGRLSLTTVGLLYPHLTAENWESLLEEAQYQSKRDVERLIAALHPQPDIATTVRALPAKASALPVAQDLILAANHRPTAGAEMVQTRDQFLAQAESSAIPKSGAALPAPLTTTTAPQRAVVAPIAPGRYLLRATIGEDTKRLLERARDLLRHEIPDGDLATIIGRALTVLVAQVERMKFGATKRESSRGVTLSTEHKASSTSIAASPVRAKPRPRRIPAATRREVWARDQGRCAFVGEDGRCPETGFLEFHHRIPSAAGGPGTVENLELRCRAHNQYEADLAGLTTWRAQATRSGPSRDQNECC
jgi:hypothetical protein